VADSTSQARTPLPIAVAEIAVDAVQARVYEEGWQSWTPTSTYALDAVPLRARNERNRVLCYRSDRTTPTGVPGAFQGDGLLAVDPGDGSGIHVLAAPDPTREVPSIRAGVVDGRLVASADGEVEHTVDTGEGGIQQRWHAGPTGCVRGRGSPAAAGAHGMVLVVPVLHRGHRDRRARQPRGDGRARAAGRGPADRRRLPGRASATG
jgi:hypothetical protein